MFTALEGPGSGHQEQHSQTLTAASVLNLNSLNIPHLYRASFYCASPFLEGALSPLWQMA